MKRNALIGLLGVVGLAVLGCSGAPTSSGAGEAGGAADGDGELAGSGGEGHADPSADDGGAASDSEAPAPGGAGGETAVGAAGAGAGDAEASPWVVYVADEDTPGKNELYAIRVADLGQNKRVKISPDGDFVALPIAIGSYWSPDGKSYAFQNMAGDELYVAHFDDDVVDGPVLAFSGDHGAKWSPSSDALLINTPNGLLVSEKQADGSYIAQPLLDSAQGTGWGEWKDEDEVVHLSIDPVTDASTLWLSRRDGDSWSAAPLVNSQKILSFELSPDGQHVSYTIENSLKHRDLYVSETVVGSVGKKLAGPGESRLQWSPDGGRFLLSNDGALSWGWSSNVTSGISSSIGNTSFETAAFTPDGLRLQFWAPLDASYARLGFYDLSTTNEALHDEVAGLDDRSLEWAPDGSRFLVASQRPARGEIELVLGDPTTPGNTHTIDTIPSGDRFSFLHFSDSGEFLVYDKEHGDSWETSYVDLRSGPSSVRPPVKVPGEGLTWTFEFEPGGSNVTYTQRLENGAEPCFFLDLSRQVAEEPVKVSGEGRVEYCVLQPRAK